MTGRRWSAGCTIRVYMSGPDPDQEIVREILSYFVRNPQAADNLEGVARWRLLDQAITQSLEQTQRALSWLVDKGYLCSRATAGTGPIFSPNREKAAEARELLAVLAADRSAEKV
jgi:hypothetical protein